MGGDGEWEWKKVNLLFKLPSSQNAPLLFLHNKLSATDLIHSHLFTCYLHITDSNIFPPYY